MKTKIKVEALCRPRRQDRKRKEGESVVKLRIMTAFSPEPAALVNLLRRMAVIELILRRLRAGRVGVLLDAA